MSTQPCLQASCRAEAPGSIQFEDPFGSTPIAQVRLLIFPNEAPREMATEGQRPSANRQAGHQRDEDCLPPWSASMIQPGAGIENEIKAVA